MLETALGHGKAPRGGVTQSFRQMAGNVGHQPCRAAETPFNFVFEARA
jgi:hypothetical protein